MHQLVEAFQELRPAWAFPPEFDDLDYLFDMVMVVKPRAILEYGSGCSTVAMFAACESLGIGVIHSLDADPYWYSANYGALRTLNIIKPKQNRVLLTFSALLGMAPGGMRYLFNPCPNPEMIYVDGPRLYSAYPVLIDPAMLSPRPKVYVVDGRRSQVAYMRHCMEEQYTVDVDEKSFRTTFIRKDVVLELPGSAMEREAVKV